MSERGEGRSDLNNQTARDPFNEMLVFVAERTRGMEMPDEGCFQKFGHIIVRIALLEQQRRLNKGAVDYQLGNGSSVPLSKVRVNPLEIGAWIDIQGRVANGIDKTYFITSEFQAVSDEITEFAKGKE